MTAGASETTRATRSAGATAARQHVHSITDLGLLIRGQDCVNVCGFIRTNGLDLGLRVG